MSNIKDNSARDPKKLYKGTKSFMTFKEDLIQKFKPNPALRDLFENGAAPNFSKETEELSRRIADLEDDLETLKDCDLDSFETLEQFRNFIELEISDFTANIEATTLFGEKSKRIPDGDIGVRSRGREIKRYIKGELKVLENQVKVEISVQSKAQAKFQEDCAFIITKFSNGEWIDRDYWISLREGEHGAEFKIWERDYCLPKIWDFLSKSQVVAGNQVDIKNQVRKWKNSKPLPGESLDDFMYRITEVRNNLENSGGKIEEEDARDILIASLTDCFSHYQAVAEFLE